jgi:hypothetical protein
VTALRLDPLGGVVRGARAGVLSGPAVGAAVVAHAAGGGCVSTVSVLASVGVAWPAAVALLGRSRSLPVMLLWLLGVQGLTHALLELACPTASPMNTAVGPLAEVHGLIGHGGHAMLLGHLVAVVALGALFAVGDRAVWSAHALRRSAARALARLSDLVVPAVLPHLPLVQAEVEDSHPLVQWQVAPRQRRGPPALLPV